jgi:hypothetical protein
MYRMLRKRWPLSSAAAIALLATALSWHPGAVIGYLPDQASSLDGFTLVLATCIAIHLDGFSPLRLADQPFSLALCVAIVLQGLPFLGQHYLRNQRADDGAPFVFTLLVVLVAAAGIKGRASGYGRDAILTQRPLSLPQVAATLAAKTGAIAHGGAAGTRSWKGEAFNRDQWF